MKLYFTVIGISMLVIATLNILFHTTGWYYVILLVIICTAAQFVLDGVIAILVNQLPDKWFRVDHPCFAISEWEKKLYQKLKVRKWKDQVWELGGLGGFSKKNLAQPGSPAYIEKFIVECNKGVVTHRSSYFIGFLPMLFLPKVCAFSIACPVAVVNLILNILPTLALRYNTPKLKAILQRMNKKAAAGCPEQCGAEPKGMA